MGGHATPRESGLTGRTEAERREIQARIDRLYERKRRADDGEVSIFDAAAAIDGGERAPRRNCSRCQIPLPATADHFYADPRGGLRAECKTCFRLRAARGRNPERERELNQDPARREAAARATREWRARRRAAGLPVRSTTARSRLLACRRGAYCRLRRIGDPARRAIYLARIAEYDREIDRLARREAS